MLGASDEDLRDPAFDTLGRAGFTPEDIDDAAAFAMGRVSPGLTCLPASLSAALTPASAIGLAARLAMIRAVESVVCAPATAQLALPFDAAPDDALVLIAEVAATGVRAVRPRARRRRATPIST